MLELILRCAGESVEDYSEHDATIAIARPGQSTLRIYLVSDCHGWQARIVGGHYQCSSARASTPFGALAIAAMRLPTPCDVLGSLLERVCEGCADSARLVIDPTRDAEIRALLEQTEK
jgi:hypothetical protein